MALDGLVGVLPCKLGDFWDDFVMVKAMVIFWFCLLQVLGAQQFVPSSERPPVLTREFRAAWVACVYNIDWPSRPGLSAGAQQAELLAILNKAASMRLNAIIFQVRPNADAVYRSSLEPWSHWVSGSMGRSPGYDPLAFCIQQAHARGIEVHAWFNPYRALPNKDLPVSGNHVTRTHPNEIRNYKNYKWLDPSSRFAHQRALSVILDVVKRYDIDGVHIDDYFYPYPDVKNGRATPTFPDGKTSAQRRAAVDGFVSDMYRSVKREKPWVRVGISPFGIWRPGVPAGTTAGIDAYEHLAGDSRKWLQQGWCDYLAPQLYWRIQGPQSYTRLLEWWRGQGERPVWPGIATARINSSDDPGRKADEIYKQVQLSRTIGRNYVGHVHWSMKSLMQNRDGVSGGLMESFYQQPALVPPMPWVSRKAPATPRVAVSGAVVRWGRVPDCGKYAVQARYGREWVFVAVTPGEAVNLGKVPDAVAVSAVDRYGNSSVPAVFQRR